jgi:hypothetical protein
MSSLGPGEAQEGTIPSVADIAPTIEDDRFPQPALLQGTVSGLARLA